MNVEVSVKERIFRPASDVFAAIVDPAQMSRYFITGASGPMKAGTTVEWEFADVGAKVASNVIEVEPNRKIVYDSSGSGSKSRVTFALKPDESGATVVAINETGWPMDPEGVNRALGQAAGWTYFLCCLKAWLQHGINLRLGLKSRLNEA
jgi:uncharacterized protein YndB with AHSA1/START domain